MSEHRLEARTGGLAGLPRAALLSVWLEAAVAGGASPDEYLDAVTADDPRHLVVGLGDGAPGSLLDLLPAARRAERVQIAAPAPGDPVGLGGPTAFNAAAMSAGSALLLAGPGLGLVPTEDARTVVWTAYDAAVPPPLDPGECDRDLRRTLTTAAGRLAEEEVSRWQPEIPDALLNRHRRPPLPLPASYDARRAAGVGQAVFCLELVSLAPYHSVLAELGRSARRALVAWCSAPLR